MYHVCTRQQNRCFVIIRSTALLPPPRLTLVLVVALLLHSTALRPPPRLTVVLVFALLLRSADASSSSAYRAASSVSSYPRLRALRVCLFPPSSPRRLFRRQGTSDLPVLVTVISVCNCAGRLLSGALGDYILTKGALLFYSYYYYYYLCINDAASCYISGSIIHRGAWWSLLRQIQAATPCGPALPLSQRKHPY